MKYSFLVAVFALFLAVAHCEEAKEQDVDPQKLEYAKGSLCKYCEYCSFCKLCDEQCPCETGPGKPACSMCKYCKFCYLCSPICDTVCKPGGLVDRVTGALISALPSVNTEEADEELKKFKSHIDKKRTEL